MNAHLQFLKSPEEYVMSDEVCIQNGVQYNTQAISV